MSAPALVGLDRYAITGASMSGTFGPGALVLTRAVPVANLEVGDVITYLPPLSSGVEETVTHRIVTITPADPPATSPVFTTKGDANADPDPWEFTIDAPTQPVVVAAFDHLGWPLIALTYPGVRLGVTTVPAVIVFVLAALDLRRLLKAARSGARSGTAIGTEE